MASFYDDQFKDIESASAMTCAFLDKHVKLPELNLKAKAMALREMQRTALTPAIPKFRAGVEMPRTLKMRHEARPRSWRKSWQTTTWPNSPKVCITFTRAKRRTLVSSTSQKVYEDTLGVASFPSALQAISICRRLSRRLDMVGNFIVLIVAAGVLTLVLSAIAILVTLYEIALMLGEEDRTWKESSIFTPAVVLVIWSISYVSECRNARRELILSMQ